jgi:hypothetical protein
VQAIWIKLIFVFIPGMTFAISLIQSNMVTEAWWKGELEAGPWEWLWIGLLPVWLFVYFRYYSGMPRLSPPGQSLLAAP